MQRLLVELQPVYGQEPVYSMLERVFGEHFRVEEKIVKTKVAKELSASSLQSPDDLEATYREKANKSYKGYAANLTETCDPENGLQLITKTQVVPNNVDDAKLMEEALPNLKGRTELETLYTDPLGCRGIGGYGSPSADQTLLENGVEQIQTAIRGRAPSTEKLNLADFEIEQTQKGVPASKLPVRGRFRVACMVIGSALATNAHRIQRYLVAKIKAENKVNDAPRSSPAFCLLPG